MVNYADIKDGDDISQVAAAYIGIVLLWARRCVRTAHAVGLDCIPAVDLLQFAGSILSKGEAGWGGRHFVWYL